jgi:copper chaperone CopZ
MMSSVVTYRVNGMTCEHCVRAVTEELSALSGVRSVNVTLAPQDPSEVTVTSDAAAIDEAGYALESLR